MFSPLHTLLPTSYECFLLLLRFSHIVFLPDCQSGELLPFPNPTFPTVNFTRPGNFTFGILTSMHRPDPKNMCSDTVTDFHNFQNLEAMVFAFDEINKRRDILPNATLGFIALDDCSNDMVAIGRSLQFIQHDEEDTNCSSGLPSVPAVQITALLGPANNPQMIAIATHLSAFMVPQLSSVHITMRPDDTFLPYFSRMVPPAMMEATAMVDFLEAMGWTYVSMLYEDSKYGTGGYLFILRAMGARGLCLTAALMLRNSFTTSDYEERIHILDKKPKPHVVIILATEDEALQVIQAADRLRIRDHFIWIGGDSVRFDSDIFTHLGDILHGSFSVDFFSTKVARFEEPFKRMTLKANLGNPWFGEFFAKLFNCSLSKRKGGGKHDPEACRENTPIGEAKEYKPDFRASLGVDAVYVLAYALDAVLKNCTLDDVRECVKPKAFLHSLRAVRFQGETKFISFNENGQAQYTSYDITNYVLENGLLVRNKVGLWNISSRRFSFLNKSGIRWNAKLLNSHLLRDGYPVSRCNDPCPMGYADMVTTSPCCFNCTPCLHNERTVPVPGTIRKQCERCPADNNFTWPDPETRMKCLPLPASFHNTTSSGGLLLLSGDIFVFVQTVTITILFLKYGTNPLVKSSGRELSLMILVGHIATCVLVTLFIVEPNKVVCALLHYGFHVSITLFYAPLLVKTNRIYRIFVQGKKTVKIPRFISKKTQLLFAGVIVLLQLVLTSLMVTISSPDAVLTMPDLNKPHVILGCTFDLFRYLVPNVFNLLLMAICAAYAFKTRALPANFNEAKFILFCIYSTVLLWVIFFPVHFSATSAEGRAISRAMALLLTVLSCQVFLFMPKLYAIFFLPESSMTVMSSTLHT